jgi:LPXTG-motif cell wall-anchored protein
MGRNRRIAIVGVLAILTTFVIGGTALAQTTSYPGDSNPITCSATVVQAGSSFTCSAGGFKPGTSVSVTATGSTTDTTGSDAQAAAGTWTYNTTVTADSGGVATATIQVPGDAVGPVSVTFEGIDPANNTRVLSAVAVATVAAAPGDSAGDGAADGEGTAATGGDFTTGIVAVVALLVVGGGLLFATRRRHHVEV